MPFPELVIGQPAPPAPGLSSRADVALFAGLVHRRAVALPAAVRRALEAAGWAGSGPFARKPTQVDALLDVPVAVTSWSDFEALYAWDARRVSADSPLTMPSALGLAVRSFFAEGGIKAWIVRTGDPLPLIDGGDAAEHRVMKRKLIAWAQASRPIDWRQRAPLVPGFKNRTLASPTDPATWRGAAHIWGVDDAALLLLPDLCELAAPMPAPIAPLPGPPPVPEIFKICAPAPTSSDGFSMRPNVAAPRLDKIGFKTWSDAIRQMLDLLAAPGGSAHRRDVMLVSSLPLRAADADMPGTGTDMLPLLAALPVASARLQLAYPWVRTAASAAMPEGLEAPEGVFAGTLARSALAAGAFRSAAGSAIASVREIEPELGTSDLRRTLPGGQADWAGDRLSLIGVQRGTMALLSDATASAGRSWRAGGVSRLMGIILRAARWLGHDRLFDPSGPQLWAKLTLDFESFLTALWQRGALDGARANDAFDVTCGPATTTQTDIDAGRTIVRIAFTAAQPVQRIEVTLALSDAGAAPMAEAA